MQDVRIYTPVGALIAVRKSSGSLNWRVLMTAPSSTGAVTMVLDFTVVAEERRLRRSPQRSAGNERSETLHDRGYFAGNGDRVSSGRACPCDSCTRTLRERTRPEDGSTAVTGSLVVKGGETSSPHSYCVRIDNQIVEK